MQFLRSIFRCKPKKSKPLVRLWDKDYNLIATSDRFPLALTYDCKGHRSSWRIRYDSDQEWLEHILVWPNPLLTEATDE